MDIFEIVRRHISKLFELDENEIVNETNFDELGADSLDIIDLVADIESELEIELPDDKLKGIKCVGDVVRLAEETV